MKKPLKELLGVKQREQKVHAVEQTLQEWQMSQEATFGDGVCRLIQRMGDPGPKWSKNIVYEKGNFAEVSRHRVIFAAGDFLLRRGIAGAIMREYKCGELLFHQRQLPGGVAIMPRLAHFEKHFVFFPVVKAKELDLMTREHLEESLKNLKKDLEQRDIDEALMPSVDEIRDQLPWDVIYMILDYIFKDTKVIFKIMDHHYLSLP